ncbi:tautomerase family protein [Nonomuraea sp. NPDC049625]|uniref:tautomerase family protein n=1 Tax=Nonomuraea sp. NPDC049625 TaxID=3155775 RepID=UPI003424B465
MTVITVTAPQGRLSVEQRRALARTLTDAVLVPAPSPAWWVNFRVIEDGSWASGGRVLSILDLLDTGVFTEERAKAVRAALSC